MEPTENWRRRRPSGFSCISSPEGSRSEVTIWAKQGIWRRVCCQLACLSSGKIRETAGKSWGRKRSGNDEINCREFASRNPKEIELFSFSSVSCLREAGVKEWNNYSGVICYEHYRLFGYEFFSLTTLKVSGDILQVVSLIGKLSDLGTYSHHCLKYRPEIWRCQTLACWPAMFSELRDPIYT